MKSQPPSSKRGIRWIVETDAHHRMVIALVVAVIAFWIGSRITSQSMRLLLSWDAFAVASLVLAWLGMLFTDARKRVTEAHLQDSSSAAISFCLVLASTAGLLGAGIFLKAAKDLQGLQVMQNIGLATLTVAASWLLVHTLLALHYAHVFYCPCEGSTKDDDGIGLNFPGNEQPDYLDFAYFSFVIGMTFQVSDVEVTSRRMRRIVLLHGLMSFAFNTVILAFGINSAATLL